MSDGVRHFAMAVIVDGVRQHHEGELLASLHFKLRAGSNEPGLRIGPYWFGRAQLLKIVKELDEVEAEMEPASLRCAKCQALLNYRDQQTAYRRLVLVCINANCGREYVVQS